MNAHSLPAQPDARNIAIFRARCEARSLLCALGELELQSTVDELQRFAEQLGLPATVGQDEVQRLITESLGRERWKGSAREYREQPRARPSTPWQLNGGSAPTAPDVGASGTTVISRPRPLIVATPFVWQDPATIPPRAWLYSRHYIRKFVSCTVAPGSLGKSSLALVEAIVIARNLPVLGIAPTEQTNAWYWNGEDPQEETERRIAAICRRYDIDGRELEGRLFIDSGRMNPIKFARVAKGEVAFDDQLAEDICATIKHNRIGAFILDPFISTHGVPESDNTHIDAVVKKLAHIAEETNCSIEFDHHVRKTSNGQSETTAEDARGATAIINAVRSARVLNRMTKEQADETRVAEPRSYFRADNGKANLAPPGEAKWFRFASIQLPNGDNVAVVEPWQFHPWTVSPPYTCMPFAKKPGPGIGERTLNRMIGSAAP